nr:ATP-dependent Clp protease ATP-binding subunit [Desulfobulbaceae bacterium]
MRTTIPAVDPETILLRINESNSQAFTDISFGVDELQVIFSRAGRTPVTPLIVRKIEEKASREGYLLTDARSVLLLAAKEMLLNSSKHLTLNGRRLGDSITRASGPLQAPASSTRTVKSQSPVVSYFYSLSDEINKVKSLAEQAGMVPLLWNSAAGFQSEHLSRHFPLPAQEELIDCRTLEDAFRSIIIQPRNKVAYIFEDIHHFLGEKTSIGPGYGATRSLVKQLYRALQHRDEKVYFFIPSSYEMPTELAGMVSEHDFDEGVPKRTLDRYGIELTSPGVLAKLNPVVGMEPVLEKVVQTLTRMEANNPLLVGHPGVGKTAVAEGFALMLSRNEVPSFLQGRILYNLSLTSMVAGTRYRGEMEARLEALLDEVRRCREQVILFIDEIHGLLDAGMAEGGFGIGDILKPVLARGEFPLIGATTFEGAKHLGLDTALSRRFNTITVLEPTMPQALKILRGVRARFEKHHGVRIGDDALSAAVRLSEKSNPNQHLPGRAIAVLDSAAAYCRMKGKTSVHEMDIIRETHG